MQLTFCNAYFVGEVADFHQLPLLVALVVGEDPVLRHVLVAVVADQGLDPRLRLQEEGEVRLLHRDPDPPGLVGHCDAVEAEARHVQLLPKVQDQLLALEIDNKIQLILSY